MWPFTENPEFFSRNDYVPGTQSQTQDPIDAVELHLSYDVRPRFRVSLGGVAVLVGRQAGLAL